jgi:UDP-N-acetylglucosamine diphosphorylase/glucosamine-1-phosphate N-acetyltransferase
VFRARGRLGCVGPFAYDQAMQLIVFEDSGYRNLLPLVYSRATFNLRCGFDNLLAKTEAAYDRTADAIFVRTSLAAVMGERQTRRVNQPAVGDDQLWVNGRLLLRQAIDLPPQSAAWRGDDLLAARVNRATGARLSIDTLLDACRLRTALASHREVSFPDAAGVLIDYPWQLVHENAAEITRQSAGREFNILGKIYSGAHLVNDHSIHVGEGSKVRPGAVLDAESGPIWIGDNATISPNAVITGPCFIGDACTILPGACIRHACSIGTGCKVGGELETTIFHGYSNKQHDGFLGHSYVGEWVNLGADTVGSDLKNTYGPVSVPINNKAVDSGMMFVGAFIGDHTKTAICTKLQTGCVIGFACNIVAAAFVPKFVPSFSWVTESGGITSNDADKALAVARTVVARRNRTFSKHEEALFLSIADEARKHEA